MEYYAFHINDYVTKTAHLSAMEDLAYRRLIDVYLGRERQLNLDISEICKEIRLDGYSLVVESALYEFFVRTSSGWKSPWLDKIISEYKDAKKSHWGSSLSKSQRTSIEARRRAAKLNATPKWMTAEDFKEISVIYAESARLSKDRGIPYEVDHIVPLCGKDVCGLHVAWNLSPIEAYKNRMKSNNMEIK